MSDNFFGFSTKSFEQFTQGLSVHVAGPGITVFGSGPDGGREATFEGPIPYPSLANQWDGYGVIQAKCKERTEGTAIDQQWALDQLGAELEKFCKPNGRRKKPEYYIFVTNVVLTPVQDTGGKDKADQLITSYYTRLPLKGHRIWDQDQLSTFLDAFPELRRRFFAQLTPGDILATLAAAVEASQPDFTSITTAYLDRQLRDDEDARLDQAGQRIDQRTALARVFVDLPVERQPSENPPDDDNSAILPSGFLHDLIEAGGRKLDSQSLGESKRDRESREMFSWNDPGRWVVIGGPGSGKSTLSQFLAQVHRASILHRRDQHRITFESRAIIKQIRELCALDKIPWPATPRFPFRVELSTFARALASENSNERVSSLLEYLTRRVRGEKSLRPEDMLTWLSQYPSLLILDGLDEVPATSNRQAVCTAIQDFFTEVTQINADVLTLATTRPAGYNEEFGKESFEYRYLPPLSIKRSLLYAHRFAEARFGAKSARVEEMSQRLLEASRDILTARLMRSPLQVTFMATLVAAGGRPPRDRWKLFRDYYDTIYKREQQKANGDLREVLDNYDTLIHRVHHDVGFLLQVHGENTGATDAMMSLDIFARLVERYLHDEGWEEPDLARITSRISDEARTRLVFLTSRVAGKVSFDVRSLQEHMAGECMMTGAESLLQDRLAAIAPLAYWRNVFLFAAGHCFAVPQLQHLRPLIHQVCDDMNDAESDPLLGFTFSGSRLALDLLEDGTVTNTPNFARLFARLALHLLQTSDAAPEFGARVPVYIRLAQVYDARLDSVYQELLSQHFANHGITKPRAWQTLVGLINRKVPWATVLANKYWPADLKAQLEVLKVASFGNFPSDWLLHKLVVVVPHVAPSALEFHGPIGNDTDVPRWLTAALMIPLYGHSGERASLRLPVLGKGLVTLSFSPVFSESIRPQKDTFRELLNMPNPSSEWLPDLAAAQFFESPTKEVLAEQLSLLASGLTEDSKVEISRLPWPIQACFLAVDKPADFAALAQRAARGELVLRHADFAGCLS